MSILTWGLFEAYWIYKNWRYLKERDGRDIKAFWCGVFSVFFTHKLFKEIRFDRQANAIKQATFAHMELATGWVALVVLSNRPVAL
jgi:hypothetical protein